MSQYLMVLNDGETFTSLAGCKIVAVPDDFDESEIPWNVEVITEFS